MIGKGKAYIPEEPNVYQGRQVIINSDRLLFNAKDDSILMYAEKALGFNSMGSINFDTGEKEGHNLFVVNSPNIYLGLQGLNNDEYPEEPAVLGNALDTYLNDILDLIENRLFAIW